MEEEFGELSSPSKRQNHRIANIIRTITRGRSLPSCPTAVWVLGVLMILNIIVLVCNSWSRRFHGNVAHGLRRLPATLDDEDLPFYDFIIMIYMTGSAEDVARLRAAASSWLDKPAVMNLTFTYVVLVCADDSGVWRLFENDHAALVPCKHGYKSLVTKGIEGYRYIASHFRFRYVMKTDVDTVVPLECVAQAMLRVNRRICPSFGMGRWYPPRTSEVWLSGDYPHGPKFGNDAYATDTGNDFYNPYPSGWAIIWSADVAKFLGMFGKQEGAPNWRRTWTVDDAAIGTFLVGLDMCQLQLPCQLASGLQAGQMAGESRAIADDKMALQVNDEKIAGFEGPYDDDVPGVGDLANLQASSLGNCAARCVSMDRCKSFEWSPTVEGNGLVQNCQLASSTEPSGRQFGDFILYLKTIAA